MSALSTVLHTVNWVICNESHHVVHFTCHEAYAVLSHIA